MFLEERGRVDACINWLGVVDSEYTCSFSSDLEVFERYITKLNNYCKSQDMVSVRKKSHRCRKWS